jgi:bifunctional DNase/RNase
MINDVFFSELHIKNEKQTVVVDARTSDAIALAVRTDCPVFIKSDILDIVGTEIEPSPVEVKDENEGVNIEDLSESDLDSLSIEDLEELLNMAIQEEKYEMAVNIRDAIKRKNEKR